MQFWCKMIIFLGCDIAVGTIPSVYVKWKFCNLITLLGIIKRVYLWPGKIKTGKNMANCPKTRHLIPVIIIPSKVDYACPGRGYKIFFLVVDRFFLSEIGRFLDIYQAVIGTYKQTIKVSPHWSPELKHRTFYSFL